MFPSYGKVGVAMNAIYGYCPLCGEPGFSRERRPDGNDVCANAHVYKSSEALTEAPRPEQIDWKRLAEHWERAAGLLAKWWAADRRCAEYCSTWATRRSCEGCGRATSENAPTLAYERAGA